MTHKEGDQVTSEEYVDSEVESGRGGVVWEAAHASFCVLDPAHYGVCRDAAEGHRSRRLALPESKKRSSVSGLEGLGRAADDATIGFWKYLIQEQGGVYGLDHDYMVGALIARLEKETGRTFR